MVSIAPSLPLDLLISIIDLDKDDATTLKAWTLVSRQVLYFSRSHLYRTIDMRRYPGISGERLFVRLYQFISNNPHIGPFVRNLHFFEVDALHPYMTLSCEHRDFPLLLKLLPELQCFGLHFKEIISWQDRSRAFVGAMEELTQRPTFTELHLSYIIRVPISLLNRCPHLKRLHLNVVTFINPLDALRFDNPRKSHYSASSRASSRASTPLKVSSIDLEEASFSGADIQIFDWSSPLSLINFSKLKALEVDFECEEFDHIWKAIHSVRESLSRLKLGQTKRALGHSIFASASFLDPDFVPTVIGESDVVFATLRPLTSLKHLSIAILYPNTRSHVLCDQIISQWCTLLRTAHKGLQWISITLDFSFFGKRELKAMLSSRDNEYDYGLLPDVKGKGNPNILAYLDEQLADSALFPNLDGVGITVQRPDPSVGPLPKLITQRDSDLSCDSDDYFLPRPMKSETLKLSVLRMLKLTRRRFETTVGFDMSKFTVSVV